jgi:rhodanese-related sulfurtransferase
VRERDEVTSGTVPGALVMPRGRLEGHAGDLIPDFDWEIVVVCEKGNRPALAADTLREMGSTRVASPKGGMLAWTSASHPVGAPRVL